ncbi:MAG: hypothetical protein AB1700_05495 [Bacillota bacterium]
MPSQCRLRALENEDHAWEFRIGGKSFGIPDPDYGMECQDALETRLDEVVRESRARFRYIYDFGDDWVHDVLVEKILAPEPGAESGGVRPRPGQQETQAPQVSEAGRNRPL